MKRALALSVLLLTVACALMPKDTGRAFLFSLSAAAPPPAPARAAETLAVALPTSAPELDTARIALRRPGGAWDYYAGARWPDFLPPVAQDRLVRSLDAAGMFSSVAAEDPLRPADRRLTLHIAAFHAVYAAPKAAPTVMIRLRAVLQDARSRKDLATLDAEARRAAAADRLSSVQEAFDAAFADAQTRLVQKLIATP